MPIQNYLHIGEGLFVMNIYDDIILYSLLVFILAFVLGFVFYKSKIWEYIDSFYYPIGAVGVIIFSLSQVDLKTIYKLKDEIINLTFEEKKIKDLEPKITSIDSFDIYIDLKVQTLNTFLKYEKICKDSTMSSYDMKCEAFKKVLPIIENYKKDFERDKGEKRLINICSQANNFIADLYKQKEIPTYMVDDFKEFYNDGLKMNYSILQYEESSQKINNFFVKGINNIKTELGVNDNEYIQLKALYINYVEILTKLLNLYDVCWFTDENIRNGNHHNWENSLKLIQNQIKDKQEKIAQIEKLDKNNETKYFNYFIWPFIIILALALKFSKAIAGLRKLKNK